MGPGRSHNYSLFQRRRFSCVWAAMVDLGDFSSPKFFAAVWVSVLKPDCLCMIEE
jgi:hypothetical protein